MMMESAKIVKRVLSDAENATSRITVLILVGVIEYWLQIVV